MADRRVTLSAQDCDVLADWASRYFGSMPEPVRVIFRPIFEDSSRLKVVIAARQSEGRQSAAVARPWLTSGEAADALGVRSRRVRQLCQGSATPIARGPEGWRIPPGVLERWRADGVGK